MKKEILTRERIQTELREIFRQTALSVFVFIVIMHLLCCCVSDILELFFIDPTLVVYVEIFLLIIILLNLHYHKVIRMVLKDKFVILTDRMIGTEDKKNASKFSVFYKPYILRFSSSGKYEIPEGINYAWSELCYMSDKSVYNSSKIGDVFYVVSVNGKKILLAYNTNLFELQD